MTERTALILATSLFASCLLALAYQFLEEGAFASNLCSWVAAPSSVLSIAIFAYANVNTDPFGRVHIGWSALPALLLWAEIFSITFLLTRFRKHGVWKARIILIFVAVVAHSAVYFWWYNLSLD